MNEAVETDVFLDFNTKRIAEEMGDGVLAGLENAAKELVEEAERRFKSKTKHTGEGKTGSGFFDFKSFYKDGGWVAGTFGKNPGPGEKAWMESVGGRAHFFEYGRSQPGMGRRKGQKAQSIWARKILGQPPRPFMRPARNKVKRRLSGITGAELKSIARKLNRSRQLDSQIMRTVNKIA